MYSPPAVPDFSTANKLITRKQLQGKITLITETGSAASLAPERFLYSSHTAFAANLIHTKGIPPADLNVYAHKLCILFIVNST